MQSLSQAAGVSQRPCRTRETHCAEPRARGAAGPGTHMDLQKSLVDALAGIPHQRISKMTQPAVQRVRLNSGPNRGIGISALIAPHALSNTQTAITTFNLCVSFVPSWAVKCEPCIKLNILWWTLAFNFSFLVWYKHQFDVPSLPCYLVHPWTPTWTQKVMYKTLRFSMYCELSTHVLFPFQ